MGICVYNGFIGCLNPYSNGLPSRGTHVKCKQLKSLGLNPYSNGLPSRGKQLLIQGKKVAWGLNPYSNGLPSRGWGLTLL